jgi:hypothetical protein
MKMRTMLLLGLGLGFCAASVIVAELPEIRRYLKMRSM